MSNPVLNQRVLEQERVLTDEPMSINGAINKTFISLALLLMGSFGTWNLFFQGAIDKVMTLTTVGFFASIIAFIVIMFNKNSLIYMVRV